MRTIGEVAENLDLPQHVLRFWETRFKEINPFKRAGGRRFYRARDIELVSAIRHLLYSEGYTIKGVQRILKEQGVDAVISAVTRRLSGETQDDDPPAFKERTEPQLFAPGVTAPGAGDREELTAAVSTAAPCLGDAQPVATPPALQAPPPAPRPLDETDARMLRDVLVEIDECRRLLKLTQQ